MARRELPFDIGQLCQAVQQCRLSLRFPRQQRVEAVRQFVGRHYSEEGARQAVPVNLIGLYVSIMSRSLVAKNPRAMLCTYARPFKAIVQTEEDWLNQHIEDINLAITLERGVVDALFSFGIVKVGLATPGDAALASWNLHAGEPFAQRVDLDDFVFDIHARDFTECTFLGHRVRIPTRVLKKMIKDKKVAAEVEPSDDPFFNAEGDERVSMIGRTYYSQREEVEDMTDVWEIYVARDKLVVWLLDSDLQGASPGSDHKPLLVQRWVGPPAGPYHFLGFDTVPGNCRPKAPVMDLIDLHEAVNRAYRKLLRTVDRLKEVTAVRAGGTEDGNRIMEANDGDVIRVDDPQSLAQLVLSGNTLQTLLLVAPHLRDLFSWMSGNLEALGGLSPQAKTLGQDELLQQSASKTVQDMQARTLDWTAGILRSLLWFYHYHPEIQMHSEYSNSAVPGLGVLRSAQPDARRQIPFEMLRVQIDPYSMQHSTPQKRMAELNQVVTQIVIPMMQLLIQQGVAFDINAYLEKLSKYMDLPDLSDVITIQEPLAGDGGGGGPQPAQTERKYVRENRPSRTRQGDDLNLRNAVMGVNPGGNNALVGSS